jgi:probable selenium-dependent hydroxylase accessory protein YqeC
MKQERGFPRGKTFPEKGLLVMESLSRWFDSYLFPPEVPLPGGSGGPVCTVIGSGGKTSLIWLLAKSQERRKVLVSPTTKMFPPPPELCKGLSGENPRGGISVAGVLNKKTGKLEALPPEELKKRIPFYGLTLLEGDGSRGLPLKGWAEHEPQVPPFSAVSIGVIPILPLGKKASGELIFRLPRFTRLSGAKEGDTLRPAHLAALISGSPGARGLFAAARGRKLLFINQVEDETRMEQARGLAALLPKDFLSSLDGVIAGSVWQDRVEILS